MGFCLPATIGAKPAEPSQSERYSPFMGYAGFQMTMQELANYAWNTIFPVKVLIINNDLLGNGKPVAGHVLQQPLLGHP